VAEHLDHHRAREARSFAAVGPLIRDITDRRRQEELTAKSWCASES
jgi:hypothetical protein